MIEGHCLCGAVSVRVTGHGGFTGACHCRMCQRWSGALFVSFNAPADAVTVTVRNQAAPTGICSPAGPPRRSAGSG